MTFSPVISLCRGLVHFLAEAKLTNGVSSFFRGHDSNPILVLSRSVLVVVADFNSIVTMARIAVTERLSDLATISSPPELV